MHLQFDQMPAKAGALLQISEPCLIFQHKSSMLPVECPCQLWLANMLCSIYLNTTQDICQGFSTAPELQSYASKCCMSATNPQASVSYPHPATQYRLDWLYCQMGLPIMQHLMCCNGTHDRTNGSLVYLKMVELRFCQSFDLEMH